MKEQPETTETNPLEEGEDAVLADLVRKGILTPAKDRSPMPPPRAPVMSHAELMAQLDEDRQDRF
jgi:hypothetical protein